MAYGIAMDKMMDTALTEKVVKACLAVRQGLAQEAAVGFGELVAAEPATADKAAWLQAVESCLLTAARSKQVELLQGWLRAVEPMIWATKKPAAAGLVAATGEPAAAGLVAAKGELLVKLTFAACDKRLDGFKVQLTWLWRRWLRTLGSDVQEAQRLCGELLNLAARMARRGWREETSYVLRLVGRIVLSWRSRSEQSLLLWQSVLAQLSLHFTVYARWDGFAKACEAYAELVPLLVVLVRRATRDAQQGEQAQHDEQAHRKPLTEQQRAAALKLALRCVRDLVTTIARTSMQDDMDIFRQWYQYLWQLAGDDPAKKQQLMLLLQLAIRYWQRTLPKSSKKQVRFLQDLLEPSYSSAEHEALLRRIA